MKKSYLAILVVLICSLFAGQIMADDSDLFKKIKATEKETNENQNGKLTAEEIEEIFALEMPYQPDPYGPVLSFNEQQRRNEINQHYADYARIKSLYKFKIGKDFELSMKSDIKPIGEGLPIAGSYVTFSAAWQERIKVVLTAQILNKFREGGDDQFDSFEIAEFVKEAYIEFTEVNGMPVAIIIGKHKMAFGQSLKKSPVFFDKGIHKLTTVERVIGFTVKLYDEDYLFGLFDSLELSVFNSEADSKTLGMMDGFSVRLQKNITDEWKATFSHVEKKNSEGDRERRTSVGLIYETKDNDFVGWVEGIYFSNNPDFPDSTFAITAGLEYRIAKGVRVVAEISYIEKALVEFSIGIKADLTKRLSVSAEARVRHDLVTSKTSTYFGLYLTYTLGNTPEAFEEEYIFDTDENNIYDLIGNETE